MNTIALIFMIITEAVITAITIFYFAKVVRTKPKPEPDSFLFNDDVPR
jgi:hypothetical protein